MTALRDARIAVFTLILLGVLSAATWADTAVELEQRIAGKQREYDERLGAYNRSVESQERLRSEIETAEVSLRLRGEELNGVRDRLQRIWELFLERPDVVSDADEKRAYATAKAAHEEAQAVLNVKREKLALAAGEVSTIRAALNGYVAELKNLTVQLANVRFERLQESLSEERTVVVREETSCENLTVRACQDRALERAKRSAVERASAVLLSSETVTEELFSTGTMGGEVQVTKTLDRIRSQVRGMLIRHEVVSRGWVGETSYYYEIEAVVKGQLSRADYFAIVGVDVVEVPPAQEDRSGEPMRPGAVFRDCAWCPELVVVPAGSFMMGSPVSTEERRGASAEGPRHRVTIAEPFAVGDVRGDVCGVGRVRERTEAAERYRPNDHEAGDEETGRRSTLSWDDAQAYVGWLSEGDGRRVPSAERERSGSTWRERGRRRRFTRVEHDLDGPGELRWGLLSTESGKKGKDRATDCSDRIVCGEWVRFARRTRERVGVDAGLLERRVIEEHRRTAVRGSVAIAVGVCCAGGSWLRRTEVPALGGSQPGRLRSPGRLPRRFSRCPDA